MEVGGPAGQRLLGGAQSFEGRVPGVGQHDEPDHTGHQGVVDDDEDGDARQCLRRPGENSTTSMSCIFHYDNDLVPFFSFFDRRAGDIFLRWLPEAHGVVALAHNLLACPIQELGQPADTAHEETGVDVEEDDSWVAVGVFPVSKKSGLVRGENVKVRFENGILNQKSLKMLGTVFRFHQSEEGAEEGDGAEVSDVDVHVIVLRLGEQGVVALDAAALHVLVPTRLNVRLHQRSFTLARRVELQLLHLVLHKGGTVKKGETVRK